MRGVISIQAMGVEGSRAETKPALGLLEVIRAKQFELILL